MTWQLAAAIASIARNKPTSTALVVNNAIVSYEQLARIASHLATRITASGVNKVAIIADRELPAFYGIVACAWAAVAYVPINPSLPDKRIREILDSSEVKVIIGNAAALSSALYQDLRVIEPPKQSICNDISQPASWQPEDLVYLMFTSGSTGQPKGVPVSAANLQHYLSVMVARYPVTANDRVAQHTQLSFDMSVFDYHLAWLNGATLFVVPGSALLTPKHFINQHQISVWYSVPTVIAMMARLNMLTPNAMPSLRYSLFAGDELLVSLATAWQNAAPQSIVDNLYGPTELTVTCFAQRFLGDRCITTERGTVAMGELNAGLTAAIIDEDANLLGKNAAGELLVSGPQVVKGYWQDDSLTAAKFIQLAHPAAINKTWYRTGDYCFFDANECYHYLGRIDDQCKIQGYRVELSAITYCLRQLTHCDDIAVLAADNDMGKRIVAFIADDSLNLEALKTQLSRELVFYMIPQQIILLKNLPLTDHGKIDRQALLALLAK